MYLNYPLKRILVPYNWQKFHYNYAAKCTPCPPCPKPKSDCGGGKFSRPVRLPAPTVRWGFIPNEWMTFFFPKTGVTGLGTLIFTFSTYLLSKEWYILDHEYYNSLSLIILCILVVKKLGPSCAEALDKDIDEIEEDYKNHRKSETKDCEDSIAHEKALQLSNEAQIMLVCAKYENVDLQLEEEYRRRLMNAYTEVVKRLDYQVALVEAEQRIAHKHMVQWIVAEVCKAYTGDMQQRFLECCIAKLASEIDMNDGGDGDGSGNDDGECDDK